MIAAWETRNVSSRSDADGAGRGKDAEDRGKTEEQGDG